jgi:hypothetical protein
MALIGSSSAVSISFSNGDSGVQSEYILSKNADMKQVAFSIDDGIFSNTILSGTGNNFMKIASENSAMSVLAENEKLDADVSVVNGNIFGKVSSSGLDLFSGQVDSDVTMIAEALYADGGSVGMLAGPELTSGGGRSSAYCLTGKKWTQTDPQIKLTLKSDAYLTGEGLSTTAVQSAIANAANSWDDATNQNLFADTNLVTVSTTVAADKYDGYNTFAFKPISSGCVIGLSRTWYRLTKVDGYNPTLESDITFNTGYNWATDGVSTKKADVQSVAMHELGHTIGLGDIYGKTLFATDTRQIMHYYTGVKHTLGNGDKTGIWALYG